MVFMGAAASDTSAGASDVSGHALTGAASTNRRVRAVDTERMIIDAVAGGEMRSVTGTVRGVDACHRHDRLRPRPILATAS